MVPIVLFCDDLSGNRSKKSNGFDTWSMMLAGLQKSENAKLKNIHFIAASNKVNALDMAEAIVDDLLKLEEGVAMYDSKMAQNVLVVAPVLCILADNVRASELTNHSGCTANKFCRICQVLLLLSILGSPFNYHRWIRMQHPTSKVHPEVKHKY